MAKLSYKFRGKITLKTLIVAVIILAFLLSIASSIFSSYQENIKLLKEHSLETNRVYAQKLAQVVSIYMTDTQKILEFSAKEIEGHMDEEELLTKEVTRLYEQEQAFNSVVIANPDGLILAASPVEAQLKGVKIQSEEGLEVIKNQKPTITTPYTTATGRVVITISHPIFSKEGHYEGLINGTVYLQDSNFFNMILGEHYYQDGSYVFVVDSEGTIIYHQNEELVGDNVSENEVVQHLMKGKSGAQALTNIQGVDMLAGYSVVENTNWGVIAQTPQAIAIDSVGNLVLNSFLTQLPIIIVSIIIAFFAAGKIAKPLENLAAITEDSVKESEMKKLNHINAWYYEALQIKNALIQSFAFLHNRVNVLIDQSTIDPLTNVMNRRALNNILQQWTLTDRKQFSVIMLDIDHFKTINDTFGHAIGDEVLKYLAKNMKEVVSEQDICCRFGGEEFMILLPEKTIHDAYKIAERLRQTLEKTDSPCGRPITISAGVAAFPEIATNSADLIEVVDKALYEGKKIGRNRIIIAKHL